MMKYKILLYRSLERIFSQTLSEKNALRVHYFMRLRRLPDLENPKTYSEKIQYRKLYDRDPRMPMLADKILVKEHVRKNLGESWIIPTLWAGSALPQREHR